MFDIHLLPIHLIAKKEQADLPGFWVTRAPKRCDRSRSKDILIMHIAFDGNAPVNAQVLDPMMEKLSTLYYKTRGSTTSAMRKVTEELNTDLLKKNLQWKIGGSSAIGLFTLMIQKGSVLFVAQAGPTHSYLLNRTEVQEIYQPEQSGQGLGLSRGFKLYFSQYSLAINDTILILPKPDKRLQSKHLQGSPQVSVEQLRKRVMSMPDEHLEAAIIRFHTGTGKIERIKTDTAFVPSVEDAIRLQTQQTETNTPSVTEEKTPLSAHAREAVPQAAVESAPAQAEPIPATLPEREQLRKASLATHSEPVQPSIFNGTTKQNGVLRDSSRATSADRVRQASANVQVSMPDAAQIKVLIGKFYYAIKSINTWFTEKLGPFFGRLLPDKNDENDTLTPTRLLLIAITIPILIAIIASTIYIQVGQREQHQLYYLQAQNYASQAAAAADVTLLRNSLEQSQYWLNKAEDYRISDASAALRTQIESKLDQLDSIYHITMQPAILTGFSANVQITEIVPNTNDIYLLDQHQGRVIRLFLTGQGFELDSTFSCGPGVSGTIMVNKLVDIVAVPPNNPFNATVMGIDDAGNLLYCVPGKSPTVQTLKSPDSGWGSISAMTLNLGNIYILDTANNAVWMYYGDNFNFTDEARFFFDKVVPDIKDVYDIAMNVDDLYLLHSNGTMTTCTFRAYSQAETKCTDPALFGDIRPGKPSDLSTFSEAHFTKLLTTQAPDASLYILDENTPSLYHFSLRLNLQRLLEPEVNEGYPAPKEALSAIGITTNRLLLLAYANQLYYAQLP
ncbi:MAG: hypothetical protein JEZ00_18515 [Anaerolineaceae bacterium]|nr:hypothetical protein [Anaerolineaceae bacterium]